MLRPFDYPEIKELFGNLLGNLFDESGRGALLIATSHVDEHLTLLLDASMPGDLSKKHKDKLFKYPGPISSFSAKIELAYVFRLIDRNLYDSLNALRKIRNDAAHSSSKFELHELNEKIKSVYDLGPGFSIFIKTLSSNALIRHKMDSVKDAIAGTELADEVKQKLIEKTFKDEKIIKIMEEQLPFWELTYGLCFLCGLIVHHKQSIKKLTSGINTLSDLLKES